MLRVECCVLSVVNERTNEVSFEGYAKCTSLASAKMVSCTHHVLVCYDVSCVHEYGSKIVSHLIPNAAI